MTATWWRAPPAGIEMPASRPTAARSGPPVRTTRSVSIVPSVVSMPVTWSEETFTPRNPTPSRTSTPARWSTSAYARTLRGGSMYPSPVAKLPPRQMSGAICGLQLLGFFGPDPLDVESERSLHRDPCAPWCDLVLVERGHEVTLLHESRVDTELVVLAAVEVDRPHAEARRRLGVPP